MMLQYLDPTRAASLWPENGNREGTGARKRRPGEELTEAKSRARRPISNCRRLYESISWVAVSGARRPVSA
jgi:hypothetical protein